jgi:RNA polymerase sigma-70 factor (ECF subfamily)
MALAGAQPAFQEIVRRYEGPIHNLIARIVGDHTRAEDLAQETFLKAFRGLSTFDTSRRFSSWLFRIAHNTALDNLRRTRGDVVLDGDPDGPPVPPAPDPVERAALGKALNAALHLLRPDFRTAIVLRYHEGCSYEEIAEVMSVPVGTAKTYVHRGRKLMAESLTFAGWRP